MRRVFQQTFEGRDIAVNVHCDQTSWHTVHAMLMFRKLSHDKCCEEYWRLCYFGIVIMEDATLTAR